MSTRSIVLVVSICALLGCSVGGAQNLGNFESLTLQASLRQESLLPLEPLWVTLSVSNETTQTVVADLQLSFLHGGARLVVRRPDGEVVAPVDLSLVRVNAPLSPPQPLRPGERREVREELAVGLDAIFQAPGRYDIWFEMVDTSGNPATITSTVKTVQVEEPQGADARAYTYLATLPAPGNVFALDNESVYEQLLTRHPRSRYAAHARVKAASVAARLHHDERRAIELLRAAMNEGPAVVREVAKEELDEVTELALQRKGR